MRRWIALVLIALSLFLLWYLRRRPAPTTTATAPLPSAAPARATSAPLRLSSGQVLPLPPSADAAHCLVEGRVLSTRSGAGVAGAHLTFSREGAVFAVVTDADGAFTWTIQEPGVYQLTSTDAKGFLPFSAELGHSPVQLQARRGVRLGGITLFLTPAVEYAGLVVDEKRRPIAGAHITRLEPLEGEPAEFTSDAGGAFTFHAPDDSSFEASHPKFRSRIAQLDLAAQVSRRLVIQLAAGSEPSPQPTSGKVVDERGAPVDNALVSAFQGDTAVARTTSESDGRFSLMLRAPKVHLQASSPGWVTAELDAAAGDSNLVLTLKKGGRIVGSVRDKESGKPVVAFSVLATQRKGALERGEAVMASVFDPEGSYRLEGLPQGSYFVVAVAQGRAAAAEQRVEVGESDGRADFLLTRGARLSGRVIDGVSRQGLAGARVWLENPFGASTAAPLPVVASAETTASGDFELGGLTAGTCSLLAAAEGHHSRVLPGIQILAEGTPPLTIDLTPTRPGEEPSIESAGINVAVRADGDQLVIDRVSPNGGAAAAGILAGDVVLRVDGADVRELGFPEAVQRMRGPEGSVVVLTIRRSDSETSVAVTRRRIINR